MSFPIVIVVPALRVDGMALFPFILVRNEQLKYNKVLIRHETIHLWQEIELLVVPFYVLYLFNYAFNRLKYRSDHHQAYMNIVFEREAYAKEDDPNYLKNRRLWAWAKFVRSKG